MDSRVCGGSNNSRWSSGSRHGGLEDWRTGGKGTLGWKMGAWGLENGSLGVQNGTWDLQIGAKMDPGRPKLGPGGSRHLQNWILDGLEGGLEGSRLVWMAILGVQGPLWTPSWGHLGAPGGVSGTISEDLGIPNDVRKAIFGIRSGKVQNSKILCFLLCFSWFLRFGGSGNRIKWSRVAIEIGAKWLVDPKHASWRLRMPSWGASWPPKTSQNGIWEASKGGEGVWASRGTTATLLIFSVSGFPK